MTSLFRGEAQTGSEIELEGPCRCPAGMAFALLIEIKPLYPKDRLVSVRGCRVTDVVRCDWEGAGARPDDPWMEYSANGSA
jgi:hypothetical protein